MYQTDAEYLSKQLQKYVGWTLEAVGITEAGDTGDTLYDEPNVVLCLKRGAQVVALHVMADPEGNGPGFLDIVEDPDR
jgi:hypothetical protein